jgi:hypothetical protein
MCVPRARSDNAEIERLSPVNEQDFLKIPKKIWFLWLQGIDESPPIVRVCRNSWVANNPTWDFHFLTYDNLATYSDIDIEAFDHLGKSQVADLIRLNLLSRHGGVWVDATCFCTRDLDSWLPAYTKSGFFAFENPGRDRAISSWFLASSPNNLLVASLYSALSQYLDNPSLSNDGKKVRRAVLERVLSINLWTTSLWFSSIVVKIFRVYPYFAFHYMFAELLRNDGQCAAIWEATPKLSAKIPMRLQQVGLFRTLEPAIKREIDDRQVPLYKLIWQYDLERSSEGCTLAYLGRVEAG